jgi:hypothetical protein
MLFKPMISAIEPISKDIVNILWQMFYCLILVKKNTFLDTMLIPLCKIIFGENDTFTEVPTEYLYPPKESSASKACC